MASPPATPPTGPIENEAGPVGLDLAWLVPNPLHGAPPSKLALDDDGAEDSEDEYAACEDDGVPPPTEAELRARWRPDRNSAALAACAEHARPAAARQAQLQASPDKRKRAQTPSPRAGAGAAACWAAPGCTDG